MRSDPRNQRRARRLVIVLLVVAFGVGLRAAAPEIYEWKLDGMLADCPGYTATVEDVDFSLLDRTVTLDGLRFDRSGMSADEPFLYAEHVIRRPIVRAWLEGDRVMDVLVQGFEMNYVVGPDADSSQTMLDPDWVAAFVEENPMTFDSLRLRGRLYYRDVAASPDVSASILDLDVKGDNLANLAGVDEPLFGHVEASGRAMGKGRLEIAMDLEPYAEHPTFDLDATLQGLPLVELNPALRAYAGFDVEAGTLSAWMQINGRDGEFDGRVSPAIQGLEVVGYDEPDKNAKPVKRAWEGLVAVAADVAELVSPGKDRIAPGKDDAGATKSFRVHGHFAGPLLASDLIEALPRAWFGSLVRALKVLNAAAAKAEEMRAESVPILEHEAGEHR